MSRTYDSNHPRLLNSVVCFMDILGYKSLVLEAIKNDRAEEFLNYLHQSLREARKSITEGQTASAKVKVFTDNIVLGWPIRQDGERELGYTFYNAGFYQLQLAIDGIFIRGGISNGSHYMDEETVFGPELLETYRLESEVAVYPRVILSNNSKQLVKFFVTEYYGKEAGTPFHRAILEDMDGEWFLNYLDTASSTPDEGYSIIKKHKEKVEVALNKYKENHKLLKKYAWIANYHNFYCDNFMGNPEELKVSTPLKMSQPRRITI